MFLSTRNYKSILLFLELYKKQMGKLIKAWHMLLLCLYFSMIKLVSSSNKTKRGRLGEVTVLRGFAAFIPCIPRRFEYEAQSEALNYDWADKDGIPITDPRFLVKDNGDLWVSDTQVHDTANYKCIISLRSGIRTYRHRLLVYDRPILMYKISFEATGNIDDTGVVQMTDTLSRMVKDTCSEQNCNLDSVRFNGCRFTIHEKEKCSFSILIKPINIFIDNNCDVNCYRREQRSILEKAECIIRETIQEWTHHTSIPRIPDIKTLRTKHYTTCELGYRLIPGGYCYPCKPGSFSGPKDTKCHPCPKNEWQDKYGQDTCQACPQGKITLKKGAKTFTLCVKNGIFGYLQRALHKGGNLIKGVFTSEAPA